MIVTEYPHEERALLTLPQRIIRDVDISQAFSPVWMGDILAGLGKELGKSPLEMLKAQETFLTGLTFHSNYGIITFGEDAIQAKLAEVRSILEILSP